MQKITFNLIGEDFTKFKGKSKRDYWLSMFLTKLIPQWDEKKYKPLTAKRLAIKVSHIETGELPYFYSMCSQSDNFSKVFFGSLKTKR